MKSSNLAWRVEWFDEPVESPPQSPEIESSGDAHEPAPARPRLDRRTIEIRDQGFAMFRVR